MSLKNTFVVLAATYAALLAEPACPASAQPACTNMRDQNHDYTVCTFDARQDHIRLYWSDSDGKPFAGVDRLKATLASKGQELVFAMNGGMYDENLAPVGLYIENGHIVHAANLRNGFGNFHLKPNGVFFLGANEAGVAETTSYLNARRSDVFATQSGPMLVINGRLHPRIRAANGSAKIRNGVGVRDGYAVYFVYAREPVTFFEFASLFKDRLGTPNALFLDGSISTLYTARDGTVGGIVPLGPIVAVTQP
ncbi:phosphodiester glycosidase family protein [Methylovirgula sp. 4M-Z18]|uniref:phosphodiester glycosidase family protein n=1 Tax=Methylovirgula sp. 4M-Z18 TaxID=2293567 RepID=UPI000E2F735B|nr:phosphodiester glycosidase family protein [Methylovirgula sp. 4M-Z18]RFB80120.1 hypothetical protein DYH55_00805 [Methylovirgula sp. 4M-Z18]